MIEKFFAYQEVNKKVTAPVDLQIIIANAGKLNRLQSGVNINCDAYVEISAYKQEAEKIHFCYDSS